jgi:replicative DNA helicase
VAADRTGYARGALEEIAEEREDRRRKAERERGLAEALTKAQARLAEKKETAPEVARGLHRELVSLEAWDAEPPPPFSVERLDRESAITPAGRSSGWEALDELEVRFHAGELALLAARTGHGKSAALVGLLANWLEAGEKTDELLVYYSAEEPELRLYHRLLALRTAKRGSGWPVHEVRDFLRDPRSRRDWAGKPKDLEAAKAELRAWEDRLLVVHRPAWTVDELAAHAQKLTERRNVGAVLVDYLQRIPVGSRADRRDIEVSVVARRLKDLGEELDAPVVAAAQLNREAVPEKYRDRLKGKDYEAAKAVIRDARPELYHLREGGSEQEADLVLGLLNYAADFRETERNTDRVPPVTRFEIGTLKARAGTAPGRWAVLAFEGRHGLLRDPESGDDL